MSTQNKILKIHPKDNVLVALTDLKKGEELAYNGSNYTLQDNIDAKHKFATEDFSKGDAVYMYGVLVGRAKKSIARGGLISTTNLEHDTEKYSAQNVADKSAWGRWWSLKRVLIVAP